MNIADLILKSILDQLTPEEEEWLSEWLRKSPENTVLYDKIRNGSELSSRFELWTELDNDKALRQTMQAIRRISRVRIFQRTWRYAAVLVPMLLIPTFFLLKAILLPEQPADSNITEIPPGGWQAELILADGKTVSLNGQKETIVGQSRNRITIDSNAVIYEWQGKTKEEKPEIHTIKTPQGGNFVLVLSDGTTVHLNAMTVMEFPVRFDQKERRVKLNGEAYFDVHRNEKQPFIVETENGCIEVLGTAFNVKCYPDDPFSWTTLCTGKVRVLSSENTPAEISPGQQFILDKKNGIYEIENVDTEIFTSWVQNNFYFSAATLQEIFIELQRWYDFEVHFENPESRAVLFSGKFSRAKNMETILEVMKLAGITFVLDGNMLYIK